MAKHSSPMDRSMAAQTRLPDFPSGRTQKASSRPFGVHRHGVPRHCAEFRM